MDPMRELRRMLDAWPDGDAGPLLALWQMDTPHGGTVTMYAVPSGRSFLLLEYSDNNGWDIYLPATDGNDARAELRAVVKHLTGWEPPQ